MNYHIRKGDGTYLKSIDRKPLKVYQVWNSMMSRCYNTKYQTRFPAYTGCSVCPEWHDFQQFAKWYYDNYYEVPGEVISLDKDLRKPGNRIYSPETCVFVPRRVNLLLTNRRLHRGELPLGVVLCTQTQKYMSHCSDANGKFVTIGRFDKLEDAFIAYKQFKEGVIKMVANQYKNLIPEVAYESLMKYEVTDNVLS